MANTIFLRKMDQVDKVIFKAYGSYPCLSPSRYQSIHIFAKHIKTNVSQKPAIIEVGCGNGINALILDNLLKNCSYIGIDIEFKHNIKSLKKRIKKLKVDFKKIDARKLSFKNKSFDLALSFASLEHIQDDYQAIKEMWRVLKNNGIAFIIVPSIFTFPFQLGRHGFHYYKKEDITAKLKKAGFKVKKAEDVGGFWGWCFTLFLNWASLLALAPFGLYYKIFEPEKLKGDSRQDTGGGLAKEIVYQTVFLYQKTIIGRKIHFNLLRLIKIIDNYFPFLPTAYFLVIEK